MQRIGMLIVTATAIFFLMGTTATAEWKSCMGCHNGSMSPTRDALKEKYPSAEAFVKAALESTSPLMKAVQKDEKALREAAREIGLQ